MSVDFRQLRPSFDCERYYLAWNRSLRSTRQAKISCRRSRRHLHDEEAETVIPSILVIPVISILIIQPIRWIEMYHLGEEGTRTEQA